MSALFLQAKDIIVNLPSFGLCLSLLCFALGLLVQARWRCLRWLNPLLFATVAVILVLATLGISTQTYNQSANILGKMLTPATIALAVPLYEKRHLIYRHFKVILPSIVAGILTNIVVLSCLAISCKLNLEQTITLTPKSVTTVIGIGLAEIYGGNVSLTVLAIIVTGLFGNLTARLFSAWFKLYSPIAKGLAIGTSAHAMGTSAAMEMGETEGAFSSLAMVLTGLLTVLVMAPYVRYILPLILR